ncbi:MAG: hypothetical protein KF721_12530 [Ignavibacteriaceae bacterium]|nr:hypothetical protein [Ignavibacteriaceae bacterium]
MLFIRYLGFSELNTTPSVTLVTQLHVNSIHLPIEIMIVISFYNDVYLSIYSV